MLALHIGEYAFGFEFLRLTAHASSFIYVIARESETPHYFYFTGAGNSICSNFKVQQNLNGSPVWFMIHTGKTSFPAAAKREIEIDPLLKARAFNANAVAVGGENPLLNNEDVK